MDARAIIDANRYMTLATADARGTPWASPVVKGMGSFGSADDERSRSAVRARDRAHANITARPGRGVA
jgi:hypothetical protein